MKNSRGDDGYTLAGDSPKLLQILKEKKNERFQGGFVVGKLLIEHFSYDFSF